MDEDRDIFDDIAECEAECDALRARLIEVERERDAVHVTWENIATERDVANARATALAAALEAGADFIRGYAKDYPECASRGCTGVLCRPCHARLSLRQIDAALDVARREGS